MQILLGAKFALVSRIAHRLNDFGGKTPPCMIVVRSTAFRLGTFGPRLSCIAVPPTAKPILEFWLGRNRQACATVMARGPRASATRWTAHDAVIDPLDAFAVGAYTRGI